VLYSFCIIYKANLNEKMKINEKVLIDFLTGNADETVRQQVEQWYHASPENQKELEQFYFILFLNERLQMEKKIDVEKSLAELKSRIALKEKQQEVQLPDVRHRSRLPYWKQITAAAVFIGIVFSGGVLLNDVAVKMEQPLTVTTRMGERSNISLPDGTTVWLNSCSRIEYTSPLFSKKRMVKLTGEACFEVAPDKNRPFVVNSRSLNTTVTGTKFNIRANPDDDRITATLLEGAVDIAVSGAPDRETVTLKPDQQLVYDCNTGNITIADCFSTANYINWINNRLYFEKASLREITKSLERHYNVHFIFTSEEIKDEFFTCDFQTNENIYQILSLLKMTGKFDYRVEGRTVFLSGLSRK
jgi:ferric-dicitrate binding protein FerR (iron transport regulator)